MRRRLLMEEDGELSLSSSGTTACCNSHSSTFLFSVRINGKTYSGENYEIQEEVSWLTTTKNGGLVYATVEPNNTTSDRTAIITVVYKGQTANFTYKQYGVQNLLSVLFSNGTTYNSYSSWPTQTSTVYPIGIVIPNSSYCISYKRMSCANPELGSLTDSYAPCWGGYGYSVSGLSDSNGKANTQAIWDLDNSYSTAWKTASTITNTSSNEKVHPAFQCCWRFSPRGTSQGDWFIPAHQQVTVIKDYMSQCICTRYKLAEKYDSNASEWGYHIITTKQDTSDPYRNYLAYSGGNSYGLVHKYSIEENCYPFLDL